MTFASIPKFVVLTVAAWLLAVTLEHRASAAEVVSYGKISYDGTRVVVENDSGDFSVTLRGRVFQLDFRRDMRGSVVTTGASVPYIDAPYISVEVVAADAREPRRIEVGLIRNGGQGTLLERGFGFWFMTVDPENGSDVRRRTTRLRGFQGYIDRLNLGRFNDYPEGDERRVTAAFVSRNAGRSVQVFTNEPLLQEALATANEIAIRTKNRYLSFVEYEVKDGLNIIRRITIGEFENVNPDDKELDHGIVSGMVFEKFSGHHGVAKALVVERFGDVEGLVLTPEDAVWRRQLELALFASAYNNGEGLQQIEFVKRGENNRPTRLQVESVP